jgi:hypothetical protein
MARLNMWKRGGVSLIYRSLRLLRLRLWLPPGLSGSSTSDKTLYTSVSRPTPLQALGSPGDMSRYSVPGFSDADSARALHTCGDFPYECHSYGLSCTNSILVSWLHFLVVQWTMVQPPEIR